MKMVLTGKAKMTAKDNIKAEEDVKSLEANNWQ
jgi:hypothetical protein